MTSEHIDVASATALAGSELGPGNLERSAGRCRAFYEKRSASREQELTRHYHSLLRTYYRALIPEGASVLEFGCGLGDLLASLEPGVGVGVDLCGAMIDRARARHPRLAFHESTAEAFTADHVFDFIVLSDVLNDVYDVQQLLSHARDFAHARTRLVLNFFNHGWRPMLQLATALGCKSAVPPQNWLSEHDMKGLLALAGWEVVRTEARILWPVRTPVLEPVLNRWLAPLLRHFCLTHVMVARPKPESREQPHYTCSVVVPARNEAGNIEETVKRTPEMGKGTEIILVEGGSSDATWEEMNRVAAIYSDRNIKVLRQSGKGKKQAVIDGFAAATGELLFILDADLSVPPEELGKFYACIQSGLGEFANGVRLVYPMQAGAMRFLNMVANRFFRAGFSFVLGQPVNDTLCGTKVLSRSDYEAVIAKRELLDGTDPFGDFDLLFGAAKLGLKIVDIPVHYNARTYGATNIRRWYHGMMLLGLMRRGATKLRFV